MPPKSTVSILKFGLRDPLSSETLNFMSTLRTTFRNPPVSYLFYVLRTLRLRTSKHVRMFNKFIRSVPPSSLTVRDHSFSFLLLENFMLVKVLYKQYFIIPFFFSQLSFKK